MAYNTHYIVDMKRHLNGEVQNVESLSYTRFKDAIAKGIKHAQLGEGRFALISNYQGNMKRSSYVEIFSAQNTVKINSGFQPAKDRFNELMATDGICEMPINNYNIIGGAVVDPVTGHPEVPYYTPPPPPVFAPQPVTLLNPVPVYGATTIVQANQLADLLASLGEPPPSPYNYGYFTPAMQQQQIQQQQEEQRTAQEEAEKKAAEAEEKRLRDLIVKPPNKRQIDLDD